MVCAMNIFSRTPAKSNDFPPAEHFSTAVAAFPAVLFSRHFDGFVAFFRRMMPKSNFQTPKHGDFYAILVVGTGLPHILCCLPAWIENFFDIVGKL